MVYCWYTKRDDVKKIFMPVVETLKPGRDASVYDVMSDEIEDEYKERMLREWETVRTKATRLHTHRAQRWCTPMVFLIALIPCPKCESSHVVRARA